jgi:cytosine/uracil/thiamine/allantoin permease
MVPWIIISNAKTFLNFMSAYAVFLAPIAGIMLVDYWIVKKRKIDVPALYDPEGIYGKCVSVNNSSTLVNLLTGIELALTRDNGSCHRPYASRLGQQGDTHQRSHSVSVDTSLRHQLAVRLRCSLYLVLCS